MRPGALISYDIIKSAGKNAESTNNMNRKTNIATITDNNFRFLLNLNYYFHCEPNGITLHYKQKGLYHHTIIFLSIREETEI